MVQAKRSVLFLYTGNSARSILAEALTNSLGGGRWRAATVAGSGIMAANLAGDSIAGVRIAHAMFDLPLLQLSTQHRSGIGQWLAEVIATFGLVLAVATMRALMPRVIQA